MSMLTCTVCWNPYVLPHICGPRPADRPPTDHGAAGFCTDHGLPAPTEGARGLRPLPRERYDAVLDSGPIEGGAR